MAEMLKLYILGSEIHSEVLETQILFLFHTHVPGKELRRIAGSVGISGWVETSGMFEIRSTNLTNYYSNVSFLPCRTNYIKIPKSQTPPNTGISIK